MVADYKTQKSSDVEALNYYWNCKAVSEPSCHYYIHPCKRRPLCSLLLPCYLCILEERESLVHLHTVVVLKSYEALV